MQPFLFSCSRTSHGVEEAFQKFKKSSIHEVSSTEHLTIPATAECGGEAALLYAQLDRSVPRQHLHSDMDFCDRRGMGRLGQRHQLRAAD